MQLGSLLRSGRRRGPDIWEFRHRDRRHNGRRIYRRVNIGTVKQFKTEASARKGIAGERGHDLLFIRVIRVDSRLSFALPSAYKCLRGIFHS